MRFTPVAGSISNQCPEAITSNKFQSRPYFQIFLGFLSDPSNLVGNGLLCGTSWEFLNLAQEVSFSKRVRENVSIKRFNSGRWGINESTNNDCSYYHSWRNHVVIKLELSRLVLSSSTQSRFQSQLYLISNRHYCASMVLTNDFNVAYSSR